MIRKQLKYVGPLFFALLCFFFYMLIYRSPVGSEDFITALMVFFAALAWSAVLSLTKEKKKWALFLYLSAAVISPLIMALFFARFNRLWHMILLALIVLCAAAMRLFAAGYFKYRKKEPPPTVPL